MPISGITLGRRRLRCLSAFGPSMSASRLFIGSIHSRRPWLFQLTGLGLEFQEIDGPDHHQSQKKDRHDGRDTFENLGLAKDFLGLLFFRLLEKHEFFVDGNLRDFIVAQLDERPRVGRARERGGQFFQHFLIGGMQVMSAPERRF